MGRTAKQLVKTWKQLLTEEDHSHQTHTPYKAESSGHRVLERQEGRKERQRDTCKQRLQEERRERQRKVRLQEDNEESLDYGHRENEQEEEEESLQQSVRLKHRRKYKHKDTGLSSQTLDESLSPFHSKHSVSSRSKHSKHHLSHQTTGSSSSHSLIRDIPNSQQSFGASIAPPTSRLATPTTAGNHTLLGQHSPGEMLLPSGHSHDEDMAQTQTPGGQRKRKGLSKVDDHTYVHVHTYNVL